MTQIPEKIDRRKQRTRELLGNALFDLVVEKGFKGLTIQDVTERANIARPTFYQHYGDVEELAVSTATGMYQEVMRKHTPLTRDQMEQNPLSFNDLDLSDFEHIREYQEFYRQMLSKKGSMVFLLSIADFLKDLSIKDILKSLEPPDETPRLPLDFVAHCMGWLEIAVAQWWLQHMDEYTESEIATMQCGMLMFGLSWVLRVNAVEPDITIP